jgi:hypothetical protein
MKRIRIDAFGCLGFKLSFLSGGDLAQLLRQLLP